MLGAGYRLGKSTPLGRSGCTRSLVFGGIIVTLTMGSTPPPPAAEALSVGVNEVIFPIGCSLILFSAGALGKRMNGQGGPG